MNLKKKERKLTPKEQKRKERFELVCETMVANGYSKTDLTVGVVTANVMAILIMAPFMALGLWIFCVAVPEVWVAFAVSDVGAMLIAMIVLIVMHELIHGLTWGCFAKEHFGSIEFGVIWSMLTPYCTCSEPLKRWQYILGGLMPTLLLGSGLMAAACLLHSLFWFVLAEVMILAGGGDFLIVCKMLLHKTKGTKAYYYDHPYEGGLVVFEK
ncbi:MAG: DUF3267 domain-containing protein [Acidobacteriota bacterium]|nr:DUF3267 domain-containing protein [Acidobacteriota bacterium]